MDPATDPLARPAGAADVTRHPNDPEAIAHDIRETRAEMDETIDALGAKLDPSRLVEDAKDALTSKAHDLVDQASRSLSGEGGGGSLLDSLSGNRLVDAVKENPLPAAAVGLSVAWFLSKLGESEVSQYRYGRDRTGASTGYRAAVRPTSGDRYDPTGRGGSTADGPSMVDKATDKASDAADAARDKASALADHVGDAASSVADRAQDAGQSLAQAGRKAESWLDRQMRQNPIPVGAVALAAGALVGLSIPESDAEHRLLGDSADDVKRQLAETARDKADDLNERARDLAEQTTSKADDVANEAARKADALADKAKDQVQDAASGTTASGTSGGPSPAGSSPSGPSAGGTSGAPTTGSVTTGTTMDLSSTTGASGSGTTRPPDNLGETTPDETIDLTSGHAAGTSPSSGSSAGSSTGGSGASSSENRP